MVKKIKKQKEVKEVGPKLTEEQKASGKPVKFGQPAVPHYDPDQKPKFGNSND